MSAVHPLRYEGSGVFRCLRPKAITLDVGEVHGWQMAEHRSAKSHDHFFAVVNEAWKSLPEHLADEFPSPEHLRKWSLIKAGYCSETKVVCANNDAALTLVSTARSMDKFALVDIDGKVVTIWRAESQRKDAMGREKFKEAKDAAMHIISALIGADVATLERQAA